jgi:23S rRNA (guanosine2251-2'-O)-methyltransferase
MSRPPPRRPHRSAPPNKGKPQPGRTAAKPPTAEPTARLRSAPQAHGKPEAGPKRGKRPTGPHRSSERPFGDRPPERQARDRKSSDRPPRDRQSGDRPSGEHRAAEHRPAPRSTPYAAPAHSKPPPAGAPLKRPAVERPAVPRPPVVAKEGGGQWLYGQHAVDAALANPRRILRRLLATEEVAVHLPDMAALRPELVDRRTLDQMLPGAVHQGLALLAEPLGEPDFDELIAATEHDSLYLVLDQVTDPHNVGAILRSAAAFGAAAVIIQERHSPPISGTLAKAASGAVELVPLCRVVNLARALRDLRDAGVRSVGLDSEAGQDLADALLPGPLALVLGAEGEGLRRLVAETCDVLARLPTQATLASLNVSNAAAIALYAARLPSRNQ